MPDFANAIISSAPSKIPLHSEEDFIDTIYNHGPAMRSWRRQKEMPWDEWKEHVWQSVAQRVGNPGLAPLEQYMLRSAREKRCVECGAPGVVKYDQMRYSLIKSAPHYWMCQECADYWMSKKDEGNQ